jgi:tetratricopeptide (TPR) repeat protein
MKKSVLSFLVLFTAIGLFAQNGAYQQAMGKAMAQFGQAKTTEELHAAANNFERIATQAEGEMLPHYYAAFVLINSSFQMQNATEKDQVLDRAMEHVKKAAAISPNNDEVEVLNGYGLMARLVVDPAARGQSYSPRVFQSFGKAMSMNPNNPRAAAMMARQELGTAQFFGSDTSKACGLAQKSIALYDKEKPQGFDPSWGRDLAEEVLASCSKKQ